MMTKGKTRKRQRAVIVVVFAAVVVVVVRAWLRPSPNHRPKDPVIRTILEQVVQGHCWP